MNIRNQPTYLSYDVNRWCRLIGKQFDQTADEVADSLLRQVLLTKCPAFGTLKKETEKLEDSITNDIRETFAVKDK